MTRRVAWLHDESLGRDTSPLATYPDTPAVFVFDEAWMAAEQLSLKRVAFIYECLLDLPVEIYRGEVEGLVRRFAARHEADEIVATRSPHPRICRQGEALGVRWIEPPTFVTLDRRPDLKRFSRYWRVAKKNVFTPTANQ